MANMKTPGKPALHWSATQAKNKLGQALEEVIRGGTVVITRHEAPKAVLISIEEYQALSKRQETGLEVLNQEFDALLARMQSPKSRAAMKAAFNATPRQLGKAAVKAVRRRG